MTGDITISEKKVAVQRYIEDQFHINPTTFSNYDSFINTSIYGILAMKIWKEKLSSEPYREIIIYIEEIISNLNQAVILSTLGFVTPSAFLIRRSYENLIGFLFYKDHPIEFFIKESENSSRYKKGEDLENYLKDFPLNKLYPWITEDQYKRLLSELIKDKSDQYNELSHYVHGHNQNYLELISTMNQVTPDNDALLKLKNFICEFNTFANVLLILFFFNNFRNFSTSEKRIIRMSIYGGSKRYKDRIRRLFGEN